MKKKIMAIVPFLIMPIFIPIYSILDNLILVEIFGCGCVQSHFPGRRIKKVIIR